MQQYAPTCRRRPWRRARRRRFWNRATGRAAASRVFTRDDGACATGRLCSAVYNDGVMERTAADSQEYLTHPATADDALFALTAPAAAWFRQRFGSPTTAQRLAWPAVAAGRHLLLSAPTGAGKTLAAFLPILSRLLDASLTLTAASVRCLYIAPLKALSNDIGATSRIVSTACPRSCRPMRRCRAWPFAPATRPDPNGRRCATTRPRCC